jgi:hypothetical protein
MRNVKRFVLAMFLANTVAVGGLAAEESKQGPSGPGKSPKARADKSERGRDTAAKIGSETRKDPAAHRAAGSDSEPGGSEASASERAAAEKGGSEQGAPKRDATQRGASESGAGATDDSSSRVDDESKRRRHSPGLGRDPGIDALEVRSWGLRKKMAQLAKSKNSKAREELQQERSKLRSELQQARRTDMKKRWGKLLANDSGLAEATIHARRMARLNRARILAEAHDKDKILARIDELIAKERARHQARMQVLAKSGGTGMTPATTAPNATPDPAGKATGTDGSATAGSETRGDRTGAATKPGSSPATTRGSDTTTESATVGGDKAQEGAAQ